MITLAPLNRYTWENATALQTLDSDAAFMPSVLYSIAQAKFEPLTPLGIFQGNDLVGFAMYGEFGSGLFWVNRILIDARHRQQGYAKAALAALIQQLLQKPNCREIRASYHPHNHAAAQLFASQGFHSINDQLLEEIVVRYKG